MHLLFIFIDGFGIGEKDENYNPIAKANTPVMDRLFRSACVVPTDTTLQVSGLPQSATGQTTILTGINAAAVLGRHLHGFPTPTLRSLLMNHSILKYLKEKNYRVTNANMYTLEYLSRITNSDPSDKVRMSATTIATLAAGIPFRTEKDFYAGKAVYQDITNEILAEKGYGMPLVNPRNAGKVLRKLGEEFDFVLFEYFQTDIAGHSQSMAKCIQKVETLDKLFEGILENFDYNKLMLMITSDHGNIEDVRIRTHTMNPVPTVLFGNNAESYSVSIRDLVDIVPTIKKIVEGTEQ